MNTTTHARPAQARYLPLFAPSRSLPTLRQVRTPSGVRLASRALLVAFLITPLALALVPWQQTISGSGRVIAFDPVDRQQTLQAPIKGRIEKWYVQEGSHVKRGDLLVEIRDNDPSILDRMRSELQSLQDKLKFAQGKVKELEAQVTYTVAGKEAALAAQDLKVAEAEQKVLQAQQDLLDAKAVLVQAELDFVRQKELNEHRLKLASDLTRQQAEQKYRSAQAKVALSEAKVRAAQANKAAEEANRGKVRNEQDAKVQYAKAELLASRGDAASYAKDVTGVEIKLAQQQTMNVYAPTDGTIFRIFANAGDGGLYVKEGERLGEIIPDTESGERVVELYVQGNDAPLIPALIRARELEGHGQDPVRVRLQFEGWPAVQFAGWPSIAVGTFGGRVKLVDAADDGNGKFRILVAPDPDDPYPWPDPQLLRQGVRARGWVLLNEVPLGFEVWRRRNGFPPVAAPEAPKDKGGGAVKSKGGKAK